MVTKSKPKPRALPEDVNILDDLIKECYRSLKQQVKADAKIGDLLKMIEMRAKLTPSEAEQKKFWEMLDRIRNKTLDEPTDDKQAASDVTSAACAKKGKKKS